VRGTVAEAQEARWLVSRGTARGIVVTESAIVAEIERQRRYVAMLEQDLALVRSMAQEPN
jgi:hypothetical protein